MLDGVGSGVQCNSQRCKDVQCIMGRIRPRRLCKLRNSAVETICNARAWLQCWKSCANGLNIVALRFSDHGTKESFGVMLLAQKFDQFQTSRNDSQQHATGLQTDATCNTQQSCWPTFARSVLQDLNLRPPKHRSDAPTMSY